MAFSRFVRIAKGLPSLVSSVEIQVVLGSHQQLDSTRATGDRQ
ncbi:MAG: hypothetical protein VKK04_25575 [Synechococcales bacterium]|nr:hypothetical protein [Synechococcales bacterium]